MNSFLDVVNIEMLLVRSLASTSRKIFSPTRALRYDRIVISKQVRKSFLIKRASTKNARTVHPKSSMLLCSTGWSDA
jgi:hypothetical protein